MSTKSKTWTSTRFKHLYKHHSGTYYARIRINGKSTWRSLNTKILNIAQHKLTELLREQKRRAELNVDDSALQSIAELIAIRAAQIENDASTKPATKKYWGEIHAALQKSWPELAEMEIDKVSREQCEKWAGKYVNAVSATRYNNTLGALKKLFELAIERGARYTNPAQHLKRVRASQKDLTGKLPDREHFHKWVSEIRSSPTGWAEDCADLVEFLAYTGLRIGEARCVLWKDCNRKSGELLVTGDPEEGTKNRLIRRVPIIADFEDLLERIEKRIGKQSPDEKLARVATARAAMKSAADKAGIARLTHHDLRHLFATTCIESGVDIPTVSKWLGHKDGGALAMKVYGHLRNQHSLEEAKKVSFS